MHEEGKKKLVERQGGKFGTAEHEERGKEIMGMRVDSKVKKVMH